MCVYIFLCTQTHKIDIDEGMSLILLIHMTTLFLFLEVPHIVLNTYKHTKMYCFANLSSVAAQESSQSRVIPNCSPLSHWSSQQCTKYQGGINTFAGFQPTTPHGLDSKAERFFRTSLLYKNENLINYSHQL